MSPGQKYCNRCAGIAVEEPLVGYTRSQQIYYARGVAPEANANIFLIDVNDPF